MLVGRVLVRFFGQPPGVRLRLLRLHPLAAQLRLRIGERPLRVLDVLLRGFRFLLLVQRALLCIRGRLQRLVRLVLRAQRLRSSLLLPGGRAAERQRDCP